MSFSWDVWKVHTSSLEHGTIGIKRTFENDNEDFQRYCETDKFPETSFNAEILSKYLNYQV